MDTQWIFLEGQPAHARDTDAERARNRKLGPFGAHQHVALTMCGTELDTHLIEGTAEPVHVCSVCDAIVNPQPPVEPPAAAAGHEVNVEEVAAVVEAHESDV